MISPYNLLDSLYTPTDRQRIRRTKNIRFIPNANNRRGGKYSYAEWAHVIGIFQTLMFLHLEKKENNTILDIGCGSGLLAMSSEPFLGKDGKYTGIDVNKKDITFCQRHYPSPNFEFIHFDVANATYAPTQKDIKAKWPIESESFDLTTALSVWTHLKEEDALFYFQEISRVLKPNGKAIITFFLLDETYRNGLETRSNQKGRFHMTSQERWIFDRPSYGSNMWFHPQWVQVPEDAIGVNKTGLDLLCRSSEMKLIKHYQGNWKEVPGVFFQDVLIFQKS
ncbi:MAG: class I SAM-dependent methyltransferase [Xenococcaceae cyanobacterium MO_188.B29]|nr:class I SAM-dependent methyltransferase [Xenococcaceae cyanobacterium MO_188.B29]